MDNYLFWERNCLIPKRKGYATVLQNFIINHTIMIACLISRETRLSHFRPSEILLISNDRIAIIKNVPCPAICPFGGSGNSAWRSNAQSS